MPIYEYECPEHGIFELYMTLEDSNKEYVICTETDGKSYNICGHDAYRIWSKVSMQPDNMWFGKQTDLGYFNSKKEYKDYIKNNNLERATRENYESAQKKKANRLETITKKNKENLTKFIEKELSGVEVSPDGNTIKEKNKYIKARE